MALPKHLNVTVTQADIDAARESNSSVCYTCPVARAANRAVPKEYVCSANRIYINLHTQETDYVATYNVPQEVCDFVDNFDEGLPVSPFSFTAVFR